MIGQYKVAVLCGSTRYKKQYEKVAADLEMNGYILLRTSIFSHYDHIDLRKRDVKRLEKIFREKIKFCDEVHVVVVNNYIGESTRKEIQLAEVYNKPIKTHRFTTENNLAHILD